MVEGRLMKTLKKKTKNDCYVYRYVHMFSFHYSLDTVSDIQKKNTFWLFYLAICNNNVNVFHNIYDEIT